MDGLGLLTKKGIEGVYLYWDVDRCSIADSENQLDAASERIQNSPHHNMEPT